MRMAGRGVTDVLKSVFKKQFFFSSSENFPSSAEEVEQQRQEHQELRLTHMASFVGYRRGWTHCCWNVPSEWISSCVRREESRRGCIVLCKPLQTILLIHDSL